MRRLKCPKQLDGCYSFPAGDLAIRIGYQTVKKLQHRPSRKELISRCDRLRPHRGVVAHLLWHYYRYLQRV